MRTIHAASARGTSTQRGYALYATLMFVFVISLIAVTASRTALERTQRQSAQDKSEEAELLAKSAMELFVYDTLALTTILADATTRNYTADGRVLVVQASDESGRIDINEANENLLSAAFAARGIATITSQTLAAAIVDWRDTDNSELANGAEQSSYQSLGLDYGPRNARLETIGELRQVMGMTDELYRCMMPVFTVYGDALQPNLAVATEQVIEVYQWALANNWQGQSWTIPPSNPQGDGNIALTRSDGSGASIRLTIILSEPNEPLRRYMAIIRTTRTSRMPYHLLAWARMEPADSTAPCS